MNKLIVSVLLTAGLFVVDVSPAVAHHQADSSYSYRDHHYRDVRRHEAMPRWLRRNDGFRHWYRHTPLKKYRRIGWSDLYEIYRWERRYFAKRNYYAWNGDYRRDRHRRHRDDD